MAVDSVIVRVISNTAFSELGAHSIVSAKEFPAMARRHMHQSPVLLFCKLDVEDRWRRDGTIAAFGSTGTLARSELAIETDFSHAIQCLAENFAPPENSPWCGCKQRPGRAASRGPHASAEPPDTALQGKVKSMSMAAKYRWSKSMDELSNEGPGGQTNQMSPQDLILDSGPSDFDATHSFIDKQKPVFEGR